MLNLFGIVVSLLGVGITLWQWMVQDRKHKREIDSLKRENASVRSRCASSWIFLLYSLALFLVLALAASRKTA
jgi:hypothetical protein